MHVELTGPYSKYIRQQNPGGTTIKNDVRLACMKMINPTTGWFEIFEIPMYDQDEVTDGNDEYIDKSSVRLFH